MLRPDCAMPAAHDMESTLSNRCPATVPGDHALRLAVGADGADARSESPPVV